jgi:hypothetical protein
MNMLEPSFDHSTFSKKRQRLLRHRVSREFFDAVVLQADRLTCSATSTSASMAR